MENESIENKSVETGAEDKATTDTATEDKKTYSAEEVQTLLQRETDKRVTDALKKADKKKADAVKEAERLAKMSESERYEEELKQREKAIQEKKVSLH